MYLTLANPDIAFVKAVQKRGREMISEKVLRVLERHGLKYREFPDGSTPTAVTAAGMLGVAVGQIAKSILFVCKKNGAFLVVCPGDRKVSSSKLKKVTGGKPRLASADETEALTGFLPGGVCPFGLNGVKVLIDEWLREYDKVYPSAGTSGSAVETTFEDLVRITGGEAFDLTNPLDQS